jgi:hypothetical protein
MESSSAALYLHYYPVGSEGTMPEDKKNQDAERTVVLLTGRLLCTRPRGG